MNDDAKKTAGDTARAEHRGWFGILSHPDILRLLRENFRAQRKYYAIAMTAMIVVAGMTAMTAWIMENIIDSMTQTTDKSRVFGVAATVAGIFTLKGVATYVQVVMLTRAGNRIVALQQVKLFDKLLRHGVAFFNQTESSQLLMRVTTSAQAARGVIDTIVVTYTRDLLSLVGLVAVMFYQQPVLSVVALIFGPLAILGVRFLLAKVREIAKMELMSLAEIMKVIQETSSGIRVIKVFQLEGAMADRMKSAVRQVEKRSNAIARIQAATTPLMDSVSGVAIAAVVALSAVNVFGATATTPGQLMSFVTAFLMAYDPAKRLSRVRIELEARMVGVRMMYEMLDAPETLVEKVDAVELPAGPGEISFKTVQFGYKGAPRVIPDLSVIFPAGKTTALVGPSGSGKSTVLNLIMRMYDPTRGAVVIDGRDLRDVTLASLRDRISFVGQDTFLFSTSVRENIRAGRPDATDAEVTDAARAANAHDFILALRDGYDTEVGENGAFLSGGQRQRMAIARAILRRASILLLDEATSALDSESELLVKDSIRQISEGVTTVVIAHRLSTILDADSICVFDKGQIVERGTARELLQKDGPFKRLFVQQFSDATSILET